MIDSTINHYENDMPIQVGEVTVNFRMPSFFPVLANLDLEAYSEWCRVNEKEIKLETPQILISEYYELHTVLWARTWIKETREDLFGKDWTTSTSHDIPARFTNVIV